MRNDESARDARMIKPKVESNKGEWFVNRHHKGKSAEPRPVQLTRTQKRRMQRKRFIQRMKNMATDLDQAKFVNRGKVASPKTEVKQEMQWQIQNQSHAQTAEVSAERVQTDEVELSESLIEQILNNENFLILTADLQDDVNLAATIGVLPTEFAVKENQPIRLDGDILAEESAWATLADEVDVTENQQAKSEAEDNPEGVIKFERPQLARHLKPLYIRAHIDGRPISRVLLMGVPS